RRRTPQQRSSTIRKRSSRIGAYAAPWCVTWSDSRVIILVGYEETGFSHVGRRLKRGGSRRVLGLPPGRCRGGLERGRTGERQTRHRLLRGLVLARHEQGSTVSIRRLCLPDDGGHAAGQRARGGHPTSQDFGG